MITNNFLTWLSGASIYIGYARYGQLGGHGFVFASGYDDSDALADAVDDLDAGDNEALQAADAIEERAKAGRCWYANDPDPVVAMARLMDQMREHHRAISIEQEVEAARREERAAGSTNL